MHTQDPKEMNRVFNKNESSARSLNISEAGGLHEIPAYSCDVPVKPIYF